MSIELDEDKEIMQEINEESIASFLNCSQRNASVFGFKSNNFVAFSFSGMAKGAFSNNCLCKISEKEVASL